MRKRIVSLLITCVMAVAMFAMPVAAAETMPTNEVSGECFLICVIGLISQFLVNNYITA